MPLISPDSHDEQVGLPDLASLDDAASLRTTLRGWWSAATHEDWARMPFQPDLLLLASRLQTAHESALDCKVQALMCGFTPAVPAPAARRVMQAVVRDYWTLGNAYIRLHRGAGGQVLGLSALPARLVRYAPRRKRNVLLHHTHAIQPLPAGSVIHIREETPESPWYGVPAHWSVIAPVLLNHAVTQQRRRYYNNGAHTGMLLAITGTDEFNKDNLAELRKELNKNVGVGNYRTGVLTFAEPNAKLEVVQAAAGAKDDFAAVKETTRADILNAHRIPPEILSVLPNNRGVPSGDLDKKARLFQQTVIGPAARLIEDALNPHLPPSMQFQFQPFTLDDPEPSTPPP